jgi:hypothetical protein
MEKLGELIIKLNLFSEGTMEKLGELIIKLNRKMAEQLALGITYSTRGQWRNWESSSSS